MNFTEPPTMPFDGLAIVGLETIDIVFLFILIASSVLSALISPSAPMINVFAAPTIKTHLKTIPVKKLDM